jgi:peptidyl-prolyl cis-trans isomerase C
VVPEIPADALALVDGVPVMRRVELDEALEDLVRRYERLPQRDPTDGGWRNERRRRMVQDAVQRYLVERHVAAQGLEVSDGELEAWIREEIGHVFEDERLFARFLQSREQTREVFMARKRLELMEQRVLARRGSLDPGEGEVERFYEEHRERWRDEERVLVRVLTIRVRGSATEAQEAEALERIRALRERVVQGETFEAVAMEASETADRIRGGDMGWIARGSRTQLVTDGVEPVLFSMSSGEVSEPLRTQLGWQVFEVRERRAAGIRPLDEVREVIETPLRRRQRERLRQELVGELLAQARVELLEDRWGLEETPGSGGAGTGALALPVEAVQEGSAD